MSTYTELLVSHGPKRPLVYFSSGVTEMMPVELVHESTTKELLLVLYAFKILPSSLYAYVYNTDAGERGKSDMYFSHLERRRVIL